MGLQNRIFSLVFLEAIAKFLNHVRSLEGQGYLDPP